jgi:hypothetical protein
MKSQKNVLKFSFFGMLFFWSLSTMSQDLPINPSTGLVSLNNVVVLDGKTVKSLKETAELFVSSNSDPNAINANPKKINKEQKVPPFSAKKIFDNDSSLIYDCMLNFLSNGPFENHLISFKISFYLKPGKVKYDISNFSHKNSGNLNNISGGKFENISPKKVNKKKWHNFKVSVIEFAITPIAKAIEDYYKREAKSRTDF